MDNSNLELIFAHDVGNAWGRYREFVSQQNTVGSGELRTLALQTATALYHFREHLPESIRPSVKEAFALCSDYRLIRDLNNAQKHHLVTRKQDPPIVVQSADDIWELMVVTEYKDDEGEYKHSIAAVEAKLVGGAVVSVDDALRNVYNMWKRFLHSHGITQELTLTPEPNEFVTRSEARNANLKCYVGLRPTLNFKLFKYDNQLQKRVQDEAPESCILSFWQNPTFTLSNGKIEVTREIPLTASEAQQLAELEKLDDGEPRRLFLERLALEKGAYADALGEINKRALVDEPSWVIDC